MPGAGPQPADGIAEDCQAVLELTGADLDNGGEVTVKSGSAGAWSDLLGLLDWRVTGFHMHTR